MGARILYDVIDGLDTSDRFKQRIKDKLVLCLEHSDELDFTSAYLFGSVARSQETYDSDIDIMLVKDGVIDRQRRFALYDFDILDEGVSDVLFRSKSTLSNPHEYFNKLFHQDKILIYGDPKQEPWDVVCDA